MSAHSVLIVDDENNLYDFLGMKLAQQDTQIYFAPNGETAIKMAGEIIPDVIILDVMMPGMDGFETCRRLRTNPILADIPIVMITALDDHESRLRGIQAGVDDFFSKPVDQTVLLTRIQTILRMNRYRKQMEERAHFAEVLEAKNRQLRDLTQHMFEIQETERRFLAAELHDDMGQVLTGLKLMIEMAALQDGDDLKKTLYQSKSLVSELSVRIRNLSLDLRPAMLDDFGLFAALEWLFERYTGQTNLQVNHNFSFTNDLRFPKPVETAAFRIIQESLTNTARYSGAKCVDVGVRLDGCLEIWISDQGQGFDPQIVESRAHRSAGISGMHERVSLLGGEFSVFTKPGAGTTVRAKFFLDDGSEDE